MQCGKWVFLLTVAIAVLISSPLAFGQEPSQGVNRIEDVVVRETGAGAGVVETPDATTIEMDEFETIGEPGSVVNVLKTRAIVDFRGESDLDPGVDSIFLRGFEANRFVTAIDALTVQKTGGRKSSNIVDYSLLPTYLIDEIEILPGPHSALYDSKSIGGVINLVSARPHRRDTLKPDATLTASYGSYETQQHQATLQGAVEAVTYDLAYQKSKSDGYLRNNATDIDNVYGRMGVLTPADGFVTLSASYADVKREAPVNNPGTDGDDDSDYPETDEGASLFDPWQKPTWDSIASSFRLNGEQPSPIGRINLGACTSEETRNRSYFENQGNSRRTSMKTTWWQQGGKIQDEYRWTDNHATTLGFDLAQLYDNGIDEDTKTERIHKDGAYLQHQWGIVPSVDLRLGLRYEYVKIRVTNKGQNSIPGREELITRHWDDVMPKSFVTWKMNDLATFLRDTSLSAGVSKIWRAPDYHGDYNPQGRPAGAWIEPEHGIGYDLVFNRRLTGDISLKLGYAYYVIEDYIVGNSEFAQFSSPNAGSRRFSDYKINLDEVHRQGVELELAGHLTDDLSFYLGYAWQDFENQGDEPAGETNLDQRAEHRVTAGLRYALFEYTNLLMDYAYQSEEITEVSEQIATDVWAFREVKNDPYQVIDIGVQQTLFKEKGFLKDAVLSFYVKNLFDEEYFDAEGFLATDRIYYASLSLSF